jgi:hypothetical protein
VKHFPEQTVVAAWRRESWASRRGLVEDICTHRALDFLSPRRDAQRSCLEAAARQCFTYLFQ